MSTLCSKAGFNSHLKSLAAAGTCLLLLACATPGPGPAQPPLARTFALTGISADGYYALARLQHAAGRSAEAMVSYRRALDADPGHIDARNGMAALLAAQGELPAAIGLWQQLTATAAGPEQAYLFRNLGNAYLASGQLPLAEAALAKACELDPANVSGWQFLGRVYEQQGRSEQAARMFRQADALGAGKKNGAVAKAESEAVPAASTLARLELVNVGTGMVELRRHPAKASATVAKEAAQADTTGRSPSIRPRLEISNGNGVTGMASALGRLLGAGGWQVARLANERHFQVGRTRIEHGPQQAAQARELAQQLGPDVITVQTNTAASTVRIVLGRDLSDVAALRQRYLQLVKLSKDNPDRAI
jgi:tetratricopeptide (TPR) repeat protein